MDFDDFDYRDEMDELRDEQRREANRDAAMEAWEEDREPCDGSGVIITPCSGRHPYNCGGDMCDGGDEEDCPGCENCE